MKISYIKIYGPPLLKAIQTLRKVAVDQPQVCVMDSILVDTPMIQAPGSMNPDDRSSFIAGFFGGTVSAERCTKIISKSGEELGEYDFFFEWFKDPSMEELNNLIGEIDEALAPLGCRYTLTTK